VPAALLIFTSGGDRVFATAVYEQFTSGTAPPWFAAMPTDVQSFVVLDYLPNLLAGPMTLDMLALASPAARPTATTEPTAASTSMQPAASTESVHNHASRIDVAIVAGTIALCSASQFGSFDAERPDERRDRPILCFPPIRNEQCGAGRKQRSTLLCSRRNSRTRTTCRRQWLCNRPPGYRNRCDVRYLKVIWWIPREQKRR
jgi:hypothetical protein